MTDEYGRSFAADVSDPHTLAIERLVGEWLTQFGEVEDARARNKPGDFFLSLPSGRVLLIDAKKDTWMRKTKNLVFERYRVYADGTKVLAWGYEPELHVVVFVCPDSGIAYWVDVAKFRVLAEHPDTPRREKSVLTGSEYGRSSFRTYNYYIPAEFVVNAGAAVAVDVGGLAAIQRFLPGA